MTDMKKLLHTFDEADEILNDKIERTNLSTIVASATASVENKKTVLIRGTGRNIEVLKVGGKTVQNGTPTPTNPVEVKGVGDKSKNLWGFGDVSLNAAGNVYTRNPFVLPAGTYSLSCDRTTGGDVRLYYVNGNDTESVVIQIGSGTGHFETTFTLTKASVTFNLSLGAAGSLKNIQIEKGSKATPYEPYGKYKIPILTDGKSQNIYLNAPLFDGEIADLVGGKTEKKYGMVVFDGSENWITGTTQGFTYFGLLKTGTAIANAKNNTVAYSDYQVGVSTNNIAENIYVNSGGYLILLTQKLGTTVDAFKTWLSTHNMTVVYELDSAATETFDGAIIPTTATEQELELGTEITPTSMEAETFGSYYTKSEVDKFINNLDTRLKALEPASTSLDED